MNIVMWVLQGVLALHTAFGAYWKFSHAENSIPSLAGIPHSLWLLLIPLEILCAVGLVIPAAFAGTGKLAIAAATLIALEMVMFIVYHFRSGNGASSQVLYWVVVAAVGLFIAFGRAYAWPH
jgi:hypothetical protein